MRALVLLPDAYGGRGGIAKFNRDLLAAISSHAEVMEVKVLPRLIVDEPGRIPAKVIFDTSAANGMSNFVKRVGVELFSRQPDLIICGHIYLTPFAWALARRFNVPAWLILHGIEAWVPPPRAIQQKVVHRFDRYISVSAHSKERFRKWCDVQPDKVDVIPNCVELTAYAPGPKPEYLLDRYSLRGKTVLLTVGRLAGIERAKGFDEVMGVLPQLIQAKSDLVYLICGDGEDRQRLEAKARALGLQDRVIFAGYIREEEKQDHYRVADAFAMPGRGEGFGIVYLEALASGIPVVASKLDASREAVMEGLLGEVVDPDDPADLIRGISAALDRGAGTVPRELSHFSFESFKSRWHHLLDEWLFNEEPAASVTPGAPAAVYDSI